MPELVTSSTSAASLNQQLTTRDEQTLFRDSLTGLASRLAFEQALASALKENQDEPLAVLLLGLDRFHAPDDSGRQTAANDTVLRLAAERIRSVVRKTDLVARIGSDEFAILLHPLPALAEIADLSTRVLDITQRAYLVDGRIINVATSIGIAVGPGDGRRPEDLIRSANLALYHSKKTGGANFCFFEAGMQERAHLNRANELGLRQALVLRQFELHYQPQVNVTTGKLIGFEALIRWNHPERGRISPTDFLPLAEELSIIGPLGEWVLRTACREARKWPDNLMVSVNASPSQFHSGGFAETVQNALLASGLPGNRLEIEITEGVYLRDEESVRATLESLRALGIKIAMDDFGTGFSSLSHLARFPFDTGKIDRSLVGTDGDSVKHRAIVRAIATLAATLGMSCIAEGVETPQQLARIKADGCPLVQGYLLGRPTPASELLELIARLPRALMNYSDCNGGIAYE